MCKCTYQLRAHRHARASPLFFQDSQLQATRLSYILHVSCICVAYFAIRQKEKRINVRQYLCVKNRKNDEKASVFFSEKERGRKIASVMLCVARMCVCVCVCVCSYARMCVLHEAMIFVHILKCKCIPARYRCDKDAKDVLALGKVHVTKHLYVYATV